jgi:hypothetical protein
MRCEISSSGIEAETEKERAYTMLRFIQLIFCASLLAFGFAVFQGDALPPPEGILAQLDQEPEQKPPRMRPFDTSVESITYHIEPLYQYELWGLVVSKHQADDFIDYAHKAWSDHINTADLCVIWGENAHSGIYRKMAFSSGQWTCFYQASTQQEWELFDSNSISNNHLLVDREDIRELLKWVRVGDQIHFRGHLVEYSHDGGFSRGSSTVRTDTGNGACETVYVEQFDILQNGPRHWQTLRWAAGFAMLACILIWLWLPDRFHIRN